MAKAGKHGVTEATPKNIPFGAGTIHKGLKYSESSWNFDESIIGATSGGSTLTITPELLDIEIDGANVKVKGLTKKTGETAQMEINFAEISKDLIKSAVIGKDGTSNDTKYDLIESKVDIETGDYLENIAFVGQLLDGRNVIVILDNALCTSGMELAGTAKENGVLTLTFESSAEITSDLDTLPYHIYYPKDTAMASVATSEAKG